MGTGGGHDRGGQPAATPLPLLSRAGRRGGLRQRHLQVRGGGGRGGLPPGRRRTPLSKGHRHSGGRRRPDDAHPLSVHHALHAQMVVSLRSRPGSAGNQQRRRLLQLQVQQQGRGLHRTPPDRLGHQHQPHGAGPGSPPHPPEIRRRGPPRRRGRHAAAPAGLLDHRTRGPRGGPRRQHPPGSGGALPRTLDLPGQDGPGPGRRRGGPPGAPSPRRRGRPGTAVLPARLASNGRLDHGGGKVRRRGRFGSGGAAGGRPPLAHGEAGEDPAGRRAEESAKGSTRGGVLLRRPGPESGGEQRGQTRSGGEGRGATDALGPADAPGRPRAQVLPKGGGVFRNTAKGGSGREGKGPAGRVFGKGSVLFRGESGGGGADGGNHRRTAQFANVGADQISAAGLSARSGGGDRGGEGRRLSQHSEPGIRGVSNPEKAEASQASDPFRKNASLEPLLPPFHPPFRLRPLPQGQSGQRTDQPLLEHLHQPLRTLRPHGLLRQRLQPGPGSLCRGRLQILRRGTGDGLRARGLSAHLWHPLFGRGLGTPRHTLLLQLQKLSGGTPSAGRSLVGRRGPRRPLEHLPPGGGGNRGGAVPTGPPRLLLRLRRPGNGLSAQELGQTVPVPTGPGGGEPHGRPPDQTLRRTSQRRRRGGRNGRPSRRHGLGHRDRPPSRGRRARSALGRGAARTARYPVLRAGQRHLQKGAEGGQAPRPVRAAVPSPRDAGLAQGQGRPTLRASRRTDPAAQRHRPPGKRQHQSEREKRSVYGLGPGTRGKLRNVRPPGRRTPQRLRLGTSPSAAPALSGRGGPLLLFLLRPHGRPP
mmetsp:Transcript_16679/g.37500  ORF Transcript_16679/g.37500 Transcript_16679/m.37500 type:complete len:812 (-) Transcript_16679:5734-8169(-)